MVNEDQDRPLARLGVAMSDADTRRLARSGITASEAARRLRKQFAVPSWVGEISEQLAAPRDAVLDCWMAGFTEEETRKTIALCVRANVHPSSVITAMNAYSRPLTAMEVRADASRSLRAVGRIFLMECVDGMISLGSYLRRLFLRNK